MSTDKPLPLMPPSRGRRREVSVRLFVVDDLAAILITLGVMTDAALFRGRYIITTSVPDAGASVRATRSAATASTSVASWASKSPRQVSA